MRVEHHPYLNICVREDGCIYLPQSGVHKAHWTFGSNATRGYREVRIARKNYRVHRLVLEAFVGPCPKGFECNHKNRNRSDNRLENLEWVTRSDNNRNTSNNDRIDARGGTHWYDDKMQYEREKHARYRAENPDKVREQKANYYAENKDKIREQRAQYYAENKDNVREQKARYYQARRNTHRVVRFANGTKLWLPLAEADAYLIIPLKERHYGK